MDAYRAIYHANPADVHAPAAVNAVAELLAEQGRMGCTMRRARRLRLGSTSFCAGNIRRVRCECRRCWPRPQIEAERSGRCGGGEGEVQLLLKKHPKSEQAEEAKAGLASLKQLPVVGGQWPGKIERAAAESDSAAQPPGLKPSSVKASDGTAEGKKALVTGIRHWSTATYTRVAIDLGDEVTYEAARVPNPDRIYFDLHGRSWRRSWWARALR
jgi:N-acetylmuramoyl-L-alanine amidase